MPVKSIKKKDIDLIPISEYGHLTAYQILSKFGALDQFSSYLSSIEKIEKINSLRLKNDETAGLLITKDIVKKGVIASIDTMFVKMLTDGKQTIAARALSIAQTGGDRKDLETVIEDLLSSFINPAKKSMASAMKVQRKGRSQVRVKEDVET